MLSLVPLLHFSKMSSFIDDSIKCILSSVDSTQGW